MSHAEERFIAGEGALAALIRAQPAFEPPPQMLDRVLAALDAAPAPAGFAPPTSLFDAVMAEADRLDAAQAPRREALLAELAAGKNASDALGAEVSPQTAEWLARQPPAPARPRRRRGPWLAGLGTVLTAALALSVALRMVQEPAAPPPMAAQTSMPAPAESRAEASAEPTADPMAGAAGTANDTIALAARPQLAERLAKAEEAPARTARPRQSDLPEREAKRATPQPAAPAAMMADAAPAKPAAPPPPAAVMQEAAPASPAAAPPMMAKARRSEPLPAEADAAMAPPSTIDAPLATPAATLAARLQTLPPSDWTLTVAAADEAAGHALRAALVAELKAAGRSDTVTLMFDARPTGRITLRPATAAPARR